MKQLKFAEQKKETKLKNLIQSISISSGHDKGTYRCITKNCIKIVEVYALKRYYLYKILIALEGEKFRSYILEKVTNINLRIIF